MGWQLLLHWKLPGNAAGDPRADPQVHVVPWSILSHPLSNFHLFLPWAGFAGCLCKCISTAHLIFWLQPCLIPVFFSQVLHSNFEDCGLLKPVVRTVLGWLCWSSHLQQTDLTSRTPATFHTRGWFSPKLQEESSKTTTKRIVEFWGRAT